MIYKTNKNLYPMSSVNLIRNYKVEVSIEKEVKY